MHRMFAEQLMPTPRPKRQVYAGLERLIHLGVANDDFARRLVENPSVAIAEPGLPVQLTNAERSLASSVVGAQDIHDYAVRLYALAYPDRSIDA